MLSKAVLPPYRRFRRFRNLVLGTAAVIAGVYEISPQPTMKCFCSSKEKVARIAVRKFVFDALPQWQGQHPGVCPPDLTALTPFMNSDDVRDPWGNPYVFLCDTQRSDPRAIVISRGPDGKLGTADDAVAANSADAAESAAAVDVEPATSYK